MLTLFTGRGEKIELSRRECKLVELFLSGNCFATPFVGDNQF